LVRRTGNAATTNDLGSFTRHAVYLLCWPHS